MAYIKDTERLFQAIVDLDLDTVKEWLDQEGTNPNHRDHTGKTPLHLAAITSTPEIVQCLVDSGARLTARLTDGRTALHLAAFRGSAEIVRILLNKSEQNEHEEQEREDNGPGNSTEDSKLLSSTTGESDCGNNDDDSTSATGSFVKVRKESNGSTTEVDAEEGDGLNLEPDVYDVNAVAWDYNASPLHLAIINGHVDVVEELVTLGGANVLLPIKVKGRYGAPNAAILTLVLALNLPLEKAKAMITKLLELGASPAQADTFFLTPLHHVAYYDDFAEIFDIFVEYNAPAVKRALNLLSTNFNSPLTVAIRFRRMRTACKLLEIGAKTSIEFNDFVKASSMDPTKDDMRKEFHDKIRQPIIFAATNYEGPVVQKLLEKGADPNTLSPFPTWWDWKGPNDTCVLDIVRYNIMLMQQYDGEGLDLHDPPIALDPDDNTYLGEFEKDTYKFFYAEMVNHLFGFL